MCTGKTPVLPATYKDVKETQLTNLKFDIAYFPCNRYMFQYIYFQMIAPFLFTCTLLTFQNISTNNNGQLTFDFNIKMFLLCQSSP